MYVYIFISPLSCYVKEEIRCNKELLVDFNLTSNEIALNQTHMYCPFIF